MVIQHNISALNAHRNMGLNNAGTAKNLEKLSSGYKINRAGDDAAGLAISEKMRGQIRGLAMAEQNSANGISLIQTAEGGLNETHSILQRMRELAVQSSNGTYQDEDRDQITKEFEALKSEIDRISESTHYNGIKLLDGSLGKNANVPVVTAQSSSGTAIAFADVVAVAATMSGTFIVDSISTLTIEYENAAGERKYISIADGSLVGAATMTHTNVTAALEADKEFSELFDVSATAAGDFLFTAKEAGAGKAMVWDARYSDSTTGAEKASIVVSKTHGTDAFTGVNLDGVANSEPLTFQIDGKKFQFVTKSEDLKTGNEGIFVDGLTGASLMANATTIVEQLKEKGYNVGYSGTTLRFYANNGKGVTFQIGANGGADQRVNLSINAMDTSHIGIVDKSGKLTTSLAEAGIDTVDNANAAIDIITGATNMVSGQRAELGALQNRLEHTLNNLGVTKENLTAAESSIRDVDMAKEMMEFTKNNILVQASQAMLAQANQLPQGVLQLLR